MQIVKNNYLLLNCITIPLNFLLYVYEEYRSLSHHTEATALKEAVQATRLSVTMNDSLTCP